MVVYISLIVWCLVTTYFYKHTKKKYTKKTLFMLPMLAVFIVSAIRYNVGTDYSGTYVNTYYKVLSGMNANMDVIPAMIYRVMARYHMDSQWFFVITSFIITFFIFKSVEVLSDSKIMSIYIFICGCFLFFSYNAVRQAVAMAIFYYSVIFLKEDEKKFISQGGVQVKGKKNPLRVKGTSLSNRAKYILLNIFATGFHSSAALFLPLVFSLKKQVKLKIKLIIIGICIALSQIGLPIIIGLINRTRFWYYIYNSSRYSQESINLSMYLNILFFIIYEIIYYKHEIKSDKDIIYGNIHFYGLLVTIFVTHIPLAYRLFYSFRYIEILSIPNLYLHCPKKYRTIVGLGIYAFYFAYFILAIGINNSHTALPYLTIFDR